MINADLTLQFYLMYIFTISLLMFLTPLTKFSLVLMESIENSWLWAN